MMCSKDVRYAHKIRAMMRFADELQSLGTDPTIKVACVIFPFDCSRVEAIGYNGMPAGIDELDRPALNSVGGSGFCHAEMNALTKWDTRSAEPCLMFVHVSPCMRCAGQIINARKIKGLIFQTMYRHDDGAGLKLIERAGIETVNRVAVDKHATGEYECKTLQRWRERCV